MPDGNTPKKRKMRAGRLIDIAPDRVPRFANLSSADRNLSETLRMLQRQFTPDYRRELEETEFALKRLRFVTDGA